MLKYRFDRIFKARGIARPFSYLKKAGFSDNFASKVKNNRISRLELGHLERLCILLKCTPNDLMEWIPDDLGDGVGDQPLNIFMRRNDEVDMVKTINSIPLGKLGTIEKLIKEELGE